MLSAILLLVVTGVIRAETFAYVSLAKDKKIAVYKVEPARGNRRSSQGAKRRAAMPSRANRPSTSNVLPAVMLVITTR